MREKGEWNKSGVIQDMFWKKKTIALDMHYQILHCKQVVYSW
jgi:hypothetical protein